KMPVEEAVCPTDSRRPQRVRAQRRSSPCHADGYHCSQVHVGEFVGLNEDVAHILAHRKAAADRRAEHKPCKRRALACNYYADYRRAALAQFLEKARIYGGLPDVRCGEKTVKHLHEHLRARSANKHGKAYAYER